MERMAFHAGADTAGEAGEHVLILVLHASANIDHVTGSPILGIDRGEDMVEEGAFVKIGVLDVGSQCEKHARHLEHIIDVASFGGPAIYTIAKFIRRTEVFLFAMAAG